MDLCLRLIFFFPFVNRQGYFEEETVAAVKKLLPESSQGGGDLASFCSWPDEIKHLSQWQWTSSLHYVNTPEYRCNYQYCRGFIYILFPLCFKYLYAFFKTFLYAKFKSMSL